MSIKFNKCCCYLSDIDCPVDVNNIGFELICQMTSKLCSKKGKFVYYKIK